MKGFVFGIVILGDMNKKPGHKSPIEVQVQVLALTGYCARTKIKLSYFFPTTLNYKIKLVKFPTACRSF
jgi:hypothetical protein